MICSPGLSVGWVRSRLDRMVHPGLAGGDALRPPHVFIFWCHVADRGYNPKRKPFQLADDGREEAECHISVQRIQYGLFPRSAETANHNHLKFAATDHLPMGCVLFYTIAQG